MKLKQLIKPCLTFIIKFCWLFPIKKNKILFSAFSARSFSDNPKYIALELLKKSKDIDCVFILEDSPEEKLPSGIRMVKYNTLKYLYEIATSKVWVDNTRKQDFVRKRKGQIYIQTWHGALPFKKIEKDIVKILTPKYIKTAKNDSSMIDYLLTDSDFGKSIIEQSFWYNGKILITGSPRLDVLFKNNIELKELIQKKMNLDHNVKYLLYAPTFRDNGKTDVYNIDFDRIIRNLSLRFGGQWQVILRLHPNIRDKNISKNLHVIDASMYPDIMDLFSISDILITDYSSTMFDFSLTGKPVFLYVPDLNEYLGMRNSYFELKDLPFSKSTNEDLLEKSILKFDHNRYAGKVSNFFKRINLLEDGHASERVADLILKKIN